MGSSQSKSEEDVTRVQRDTSSPSYSKYGEKQSLEADRQPTDDQTKTAIPANSQQAKLDLLPDDNLHGESIVNSDIDIYAGQMKQYETKSDEDMSLFEKKLQRRYLFRRNRGPPSRPIPPPYHRLSQPQETTTLSFMDDFDQSLLQITTPTTTTTTTTEKTTTTTPPPIDWDKISGETFGDWLGGVHYKYPTKYSDVTPQFLAPINVDDETGDLLFVKSNALLTESEDDEKASDTERQSPQAESRHDEKGGVEVDEDKANMQNDLYQTTKAPLSLYHGGPALYRLPGPNAPNGPEGNARRGHRGRFLPNGRFVSRPPFRGGPRGRFAATRRYANGPNGPRGGPPLFNQRGQGRPPLFRGRGPPLGGRYRGRQNVGPPLPSHIEGGPSLEPITYIVDNGNELPPQVSYDGAPSLTSNGNYEIGEENEVSPYDVPHNSNNPIDGPVEYEDEEAGKQYGIDLNNNQLNPAPEQYSNRPSRNYDLSQVNPYGGGDPYNDNGNNNGPYRGRGGFQRGPHRGFRGRGRGRGGRFIPPQGYIEEKPIADYDENNLNEINNALANDYEEVPTSEKYEAYRFSHPGNPNQGPPPNGLPGRGNHYNIQSNQGGPSHRGPYGGRGGRPLPPPNVRPPTYRPPGYEATTTEAPFDGKKDFESDQHLFPQLGGQDKPQPQGGPFDNFDTEPQDYDGPRGPYPNGPGDTGRGDGPSGPSGPRGGPSGPGNGPSGHRSGPSGPGNAPSGLSGPLAPNSPSGPTGETGPSGPYRGSGQFGGRGRGAPYLAQGHPYSGPERNPNYDSPGDVEYDDYGFPQTAPKRKRRQPAPIDDFDTFEEKKPPPRPQFDDYGFEIEYPAPVKDPDAEHFDGFGFEDDSKNKNPPFQPGPFQQRGGFRGRGNNRGGRLVPLILTPRRDQRGRGGLRFNRGGIGGLLPGVIPFFAPGPGRGRGGPPRGVGGPPQPQDDFEDFGLFHEGGGPINGPPQRGPPPHALPGPFSGPGSGPGRGRFRGRGGGLRGGPPRRPGRPPYNDAPSDYSDGEPGPNQPYPPLPDYGGPKEHNSARGPFTDDPSDYSNASDSPDYNYNTSPNESPNFYDDDEGSSNYNDGGLPSFNAGDGPPNYSDGDGPPNYNGEDRPPNYNDGPPNYNEGPEASDYHENGPPDYGKGPEGNSPDYPGPNGPPDFTDYSDRGTGQYGPPSDYGPSRDYYNNDGEGERGPPQYSEYGNRPEPGESKDFDDYGNDGPFGPSTGSRSHGTGFDYDSAGFSNAPESAQRDSPPNEFHEVLVFDGPPNDDEHENAPFLHENAPFLGEKTTKPKYFYERKPPGPPQEKIIKGPQDFIGTYQKSSNSDFHKTHEGSLSNTNARADYIPADHPGPGPGLGGFTLKTDRPEVSTSNGLAQNGHNDASTTTPFPPFGQKLNEYFAERPSFLDNVATISKRTLSIPQEVKARGPITFADQAASFSRQGRNLNLSTNKPSVLSIDSSSNSSVPSLNSLMGALTLVNLSGVVSNKASTPRDAHSHNTSAEDSLLTSVWKGIEKWTTINHDPA